MKFAAFAAEAIPLCGKRSRPRMRSLTAKRGVFYFFIGFSVLGSTAAHRNTIIAEASVALRSI